MEHVVVCENCHSEKKAMQMHSLQICIRCHEKIKETKKKTLASRQRTLLRHKFLRENGLVCIHCKEHRSYGEFPLNARTGRIMELKRCFTCQTPSKICAGCMRPVADLRELHAVHKLCYTCNLQRLEALKQNRKCGLCTTVKSVREFDEGKPYCKECAKLFNTSACKTCKAVFESPEMMPPEQKECIYCVLRRNDEEDVIRLRDLMRQNATISKKIANYIKNNHQNFL